MADAVIRATTEADRPWMRQFMAEQWGSDRMVAHGELFYPAEHEGFVAERDGKPAGLVTYRIDGDACEITMIESVERHRGTGTGLLAAVEVAARRRGCTYLCLTTTNDNVDALRFYQRRGFSLAALHAGVMDANRDIKPEISQTGEYGIPIRDELELEKYL
jgi:GNAT superfamily N-acetyltransferase